MFSQNLHLRVVVLFLWEINELSEIAWDMSMTMMTSSNGNIFRVTGPLCGEFTGLGEFPTQRPVTRSFDVFFDVRLIKRLSKHSRGWWFETLSHPLWRHRNTYLGHNKSHDVLHWPYERHCDCGDWNPLVCSPPSSAWHQRNYKISA